MGGGGGLLGYSVSPLPFPLDFGFGIWDLDLGLDLGLTIITKFEVRKHTPQKKLRNLRHTSNHR